MFALNCITAMSLLYCKQRFILGFNHEISCFPVIVFYYRNIGDTGKKQVLRKIEKYNQDPLSIKEEFVPQRDRETQTEAFLFSHKKQDDSNESKDDKLFCILYPEFIGLSKVQLGELLTEKIQKIEKLEDKNHKLEVAMKALL
ncbi:CLUMA_CG012253, isoform A [Clunio marinus]|uniref:CLUMA_CG012253, isoform A n=1 Tax=Clunio marinus TaxID=568069 RepID=A0A1J1IFC2_9DIPT|nr:CLUMA_CG012253, isoform A [Clunio marinus]